MLGIILVRFIAIVTNNDEHFEPIGAESRLINRLFNAIEDHFPWITPCRDLMGADFVNEPWQLIGRLEGSHLDGNEVCARFVIIKGDPNSKLRTHGQLSKGVNNLFNRTSRVREQVDHALRIVNDEHEFQRFQPLLNNRQPTLQIGNICFRRHGNTLLVHEPPRNTDSEELPARILVLDLFSISLRILPAKNGKPRPVGRLRNGPVVERFTEEVLTAVCVGFWTGRQRLVGARPNFARMHGAAWRCAPLNGLAGCPKLEIFQLHPAYAHGLCI